MPGSVVVSVEKRTYSPKEAARLAGCSVKCLYGAITRGEVPGVLRIGRKLLLSKRLFDAYLDGEARS